MRVFKLEVTEETMKHILDGLCELPYKTAAVVIAQLQQQVQPQLQPKQRKPKAVPTDAP